MAVYYLDEQKTKKLVVKTKAFWKNTEVIYNDALIDTIPAVADLRAGRTYQPEPGMEISIQLLKNGFGDPEMIDIKVNGKTIPGSASDPMNGITSAFVTLLVLGGFHFVIGIIGLMSTSGFFGEPGVGIGGIIIGLLFTGLGFLLKATKSSAPIIIAMLIIIADMALTLYFNAQNAEARTPLTGIGLKVLYLVWLFRGIRGVNAYREQQAGAG